MSSLSSSRERFYVLEIGELRHNRNLPDSRGKLAKANLQGDSRPDIMRTSQMIPLPYFRQKETPIVVEPA